MQDAVRCSQCHLAWKGAEGGLVQCRLVCVGCMHSVCVCTVQCAVQDADVCSVHCTVWSCSMQYTLRSVDHTRCSVHYAVRSMQWSACRMQMRAPVSSFLDAELITSLILEGNDQNWHKSCISSLKLDTYKNIIAMSLANVWELLTEKRRKRWMGNPCYDVEI